MPTDEPTLEATATSSLVVAIPIAPIDSEQADPHVTVMVGVLHASDPETARENGLRRAKAAFPFSDNFCYPTEATDPAITLLDDPAAVLEAIIAVGEDSPVTAIETLPSEQDELQAAADCLQAAGLLDPSD